MTGLDIFIFILLVPLFIIPVGLIVGLILIIISSVIFQIREKEKE